MPLPRPGRSVTIATLLLVTCAPLDAQTPKAGPSAEPPLELSRLTGPVVVDGVPDEEAWRRIEPLPLTLYTPVFRGTPTQRTEIRVAYDDESFYAAGWFFDTDAKNIRINSLYRDRWNGDDALAIYIDAFNDNQTAKWFGLTAGGVRFDILLSDDGGTSNGSWDTFWGARTTVTDSGWFAEVRIPFSSLGFRADDEGKAVMGLTVTRLVSRGNERVTFPAIDPRFEFRRPSVARDVVLRDVQARRPLYVTPFAVTGRARSMIERPAAGGVPAGFALETEAEREMGVDVRYPLSAKLTLDLTVNTDFAQVEADDQQVNLDRFPLFYPERRRFFQEGSGLFDFAAGGGSRLFHSRRIGLAPGRGAELEPVPILGGARLVGRVGAWDVGLLEMQTRPMGARSAENFGVLRLRRGVLNPFSSAGLMATSFLADGRRSLALGGDGTLRVHGDHYLTLRAAATDDDSTGGALVRRALADLKWERRTGRGLGYTLWATHAGRDFRPELGFLPRRDFTMANAIGNWYFFTDSHRWLRRIYPGALAFSTFRNADRTLESGQYAVWVQWDTKSGGGGWVEPKRFREDVLRPFTIGGTATVPKGSYDFADLQVVLNMSQGAKLRTGVDVRTGTYFDGTRTQVILTPTWNASPHLELGADYQLSRLAFEARRQKVDVHVARLRLRGALDAARSGNAFVQYNSTTERLDVNLRLRWAFAEGTDLWLVYNEGLDTERARDLVGVESPFSLARTVLVKYSHTVSF